MHLSRLSVSIVVALVLIVWLGYQWLVHGVQPSLAQLEPFSIVVAALLSIGLLFEHILWRLPGVRNLIKLPDLAGTWQADLQSSYVRPGETDPIDPIRCYFVIAQTYSKLKVRLLTPESSSGLLAYDIRKSDFGDGYQILGVYRNEPRVHHRYHSEIHRGALFLNTHGDHLNPSSMDGEYWTDRETKGSLNLVERVKKEHSKYEDAFAEFEAVADAK